MRRRGAPLTKGETMSRTTRMEADILARRRKEAIKAMESQENEATLREIRELQARIIELLGRLGHART